jgi:predicted acylesterase/phospholipase RssA
MASPRTGRRERRSGQSTERSSRATRQAPAWRGLKISGAPRLARIRRAAVHVTTGTLAHFDSFKQTVDPQHVMASAALPPGFPAVLIDDELYSDGGVYSNMPLDAVLDDTPRVGTCVLGSICGARPALSFIPLAKRKHACGRCFGSFSAIPLGFLPPCLSFHMLPIDNRE